VARFPLTQADRRDLLDRNRRPVEPDVRLRACIPRSPDFSRKPFIGVSIRIESAQALRTGFRR
jgi:hypothetical protein